MYTIRSRIRGYPVYCENWTAVLGEELACEHESSNMVDRYAVAVKKDSGEIVGHVPKKISRMCSSFLDLGVQITAVVTGRRRYSSDLVQGGLEIPCDLRFTGHQQHIEKLKRIMKLKRRLRVAIS